MGRLRRLSGTLWRRLGVRTWSTGTKEGTPGSVFLEMSQIRNLRNPPPRVRPLWYSESVANLGLCLAVLQLALLADDLQIGPLAPQ
jgi:hypothetical protein